MIAYARFRGAALLSLATAFAASGCRFVGATTHNLAELHWSDGRHKRSGDLVSPLEWALRQGLQGIVTGAGGKLREETPEPIEDPIGECADNLRDLERFDPADRRVARAQVEHFARAAVFDPWILSREIAVRGLGEAGRRLALGEHAVPAPPQSPATVEAVRDAVRALVQASGGGDPEAQAQLGEACLAVRALEVDLDGALRILRTAAILEGATEAGGGTPEAVAELAEDFSRRCAAYALAHALRDEPPSERAGVDPGWRKGRVRAAAVAANVRAFGAPKYAEIVHATWMKELDVEVLTALCELIARRGFPEPPASVAENERAALLERWTERLVALAIDHPEGRARVAAMAALAVVSGRDPSLREEDWQAWWTSHAAAREPRAP